MRAQYLYIWTNERSPLCLQVEKCHVLDCDIYIPGQWSAWSDCSASCGTGEKVRHRACYSEQRQCKVEEQRCTSLPYHQYYQQTAKCRLAECPVDGGWSRWEGWSRCSQNCLDYPGDGKTLITKARRTRKRHCVNPSPAFGGRFCAKDERLEWLSHEKAELEETECLSPLSEGGEEGAEVTPWCPQNCILTPWSEWSHCSPSCVVSRLGPTVEYDGYDPEHRLSRYH